MDKISILIPAYKIKPNIKIIDKCMAGYNYEIIIENDKYGLGKGATLQRAFEKSTGNRIVWLDADMQISPKHIPEYLKVDVDVVVASKLHPLSKMNYSWLRKKITLISSLIIKILFNLPVRDTQTGLKIFKREVLEEDYRIKGFGHDIEVLTKAYQKGYLIVEMPVTIQRCKWSSVRLKGIIGTLWELVWLKWQLAKNKKW